MKNFFSTNIFKILAILTLITSLWLMITKQNDIIIFGLASNVVAGYIFYIIIELIPRKAKERKAFKVLMSFSDLERKLAQLLGVIDGLIEIDADDKISFPLEKEYFVVENIIFEEKISDFILQYSKKVQKELAKIIQLPFFRDLDENNAAIITELHTSRFFSITLKSVALCDEKKQKKFGYHNIRKTLERTMFLYNQLFQKEIKKAHGATVDEIDIYNQRIEMHREYYGENEKIYSYLNGIGVKQL